jgi:hypothetical protein
MLGKSLVLSRDVDNIVVLGLCRNSEWPEKVDVLPIVAQVNHEDPSANVVSDNPLQEDICAFLGALQEAT